MMKRIVLISLVISVVGLASIYVTAINFEPEVLNIGDISSDLVGSTVTTEGYIKSKTMHQNGHMFLTITDGKETLDVPVFSSVMQYLNKDDFRIKSKVKVTGVIDEYRKKLQIIPRSQKDVTLV